MLVEPLGDPEDDPGFPSGSILSSGEDDYYFVDVCSCHARVMLD
jgi:hypothetical protein